MVVFVACAALPGRAAADGWSTPVAVQDHPTGIGRGEFTALGSGAAMLSSDQPEVRGDTPSVWTESVTRGGATNTQTLDDGYAYDEVLAADAAGDATVAWINTDNARAPAIRVADRPAGGHFGAPDTVAQANGPAALGMNARGDTLLVYWKEAADGLGSGLYALWRPAGGSF